MLNVRGKYTKHCRHFNRCQLKFVKTRDNEASELTSSIQETVRARLAYFGKGHPIWKAAPVE